MTPEKFDVDPMARKADIVIDEALKQMKGLQGDAAAIKGTLKGVIVTEILRTQNMNGEEETRKLAKYLKDNIENWMFHTHKDLDAEIKRDSLQYLQDYLISRRGRKDAENLPDNDSSQEDDDKNDLKTT
ncbi:MAG: hypothetical protein QMD65_02235 [Patescibacteria group bacterium]|nr:hypothetical protein [Patescibacteria group bacterium]